MHINKKAAGEHPLSLHIPAPLLHLEQGVMEPLEMALEVDSEGQIPGFSQDGDTCCPSCFENWLLATQSHSLWTVGNWKKLAQEGWNTLPRDT